MRVIFANFTKTYSRSNDTQGKQERNHLILEGRQRRRWRRKKTMKMPTAFELFLKLSYFMSPLPSVFMSSRKYFVHT